MQSTSGENAVKAGYVVKAMGAGNRMRGIMAVTFDRGIRLLAFFLKTWGNVLLARFGRVKHISRLQ
jgi:hypothetical protein